jgi:hypothetical protein
MTEQEPRNSIVLVIIFWVVIPSVVICYFVHSIYLFTQNPTDASFDANLHVLWTIIKAVFFLIIGYFLLAVPGIALDMRKAKFKEWQEQEDDRAERSLRQQEYKTTPTPSYNTTSDDFYQKTDLLIARADKRLREFEEVERATELDKLKKELEELKAVRPV